MTATAAPLKDYSLRPVRDPRIEEAIEAVKWHSSNLSRAELKALVKRDDFRAGRHMAIWFAALAAAGTAAYFAWGSWWAVPAFLIYGVVYNSADSKWHELSHGTPFRSHWVNEALYVLVSFMTLREPVRWRWSHARHHTHTILVGHDPEIAAPRPPSILKAMAGLWYLRGGYQEIRSIILIACGRMTRDAQVFVPRGQWPRMVLFSRLFIAYFATVAGACIAAGTVLPAMFVVLPRFYGSFLHYTKAFTQHAGLAEDVLDHRLNARTVILNPVFAFLYTNMNYHVEHHMFPMVPFYRLPELHERIRSDCPPPYRGLLDAYREIIPTLLRQVKDPTYFVRRVLPDGASGAHGTDLLKAA